MKSIQIVELVAGVVGILGVGASFVIKIRIFPCGSERLSLAKFANRIFFLGVFFVFVSLAASIFQMAEYRPNVSLGSLENYEVISLKDLDNVEIGQKIKIEGDIKTLDIEKEVATLQNDGKNIEITGVSSEKVSSIAQLNEETTTHLTIYGEIKEITPESCVISIVKEVSRKDTSSAISIALIATLTYSVLLVGFGLVGRNDW